MSDPLSDECAYCGSPSVLDEAWFCDRPKCWAAWEAECQAAEQDMADKRGWVPLEDE